ncbi:C-C motif chemokine 20-like, partial [Pelobates cultripes]
FASLFYVNTAEGLFDCCYTYTRKPLPRKQIKGYVMQNSYEVCDIDAVILITKKFKVCANPKDKWVMKIIKAKSKGPKSPGKHVKPTSDSSGN